MDRLGACAKSFLMLTARASRASVADDWRVDDIGSALLGLALLCAKPAPVVWPKKATPTGPRYDLRSDVALTRASRGDQSRLF